MHVRYWNRTSPHMRRIAPTLLRRRFAALLSRESLEEMPEVDDRRSVVDLVEQELIPGLQEILGERGRTADGLDIVRLDMSSLVFGRVRFFRIARFLASVEALIRCKRPRRVTIRPSLHYTDWLFVRSLKEYGVSSGGISKLVAGLSRMLLSVSDRKIYAPRAFKAMPVIPDVTCDILFIATMETHAKNLIPLMHAARKQGRSIGLVVSSGVKGWKCLGSIPEGTAIFNFRDFITADDVAAHERDREAYRTHFKRDASRLAALCRIKGVDCWPLMKAGLRDWYEEVLPANLLYVRISRRILDSGPKALINSRVLRASETALAAVARKRGIRVTTVLHGLITDEPDFYYASGRFDLSSLVYVWNEPQKEHVVRKRKEMDGGIIIDGNPQWEYFASISSDRNRLFQLLNRDAAAFDRILAFCAQPANTTETWKTLVDSARSSPNVLCVIKTHPTVPKKRITDALTNMPSNVIVADDDTCSLATLLKAADLLLTVTSTTLFEALVLGTPVMLVRAHSYAFVDELRSYGLPVAATDEAVRQVFISSRSKEEYWNDCAEFRRRYLGNSADSVTGVSGRILAAAIDGTVRQAMDAGESTTRKPQD